MGDINENQLELPNNFNTICSEYHLTQMISEPTHEANLLDIIATTIPNKILTFGTLPPIFSKHNPVYATLNLARLPTVKYKRTIYNYKRADWAGLKTDIKEQISQEVFNKPTADEMAIKWTENMKVAINTHIPSREVTIDPNEAPWMQKNIKILISKRNAAYKKAKLSGSDKDYENFKKLRTKIKEQIEKSKEEYNCKLEEKINIKSNTNDKTWWNLAKQILNKNKPQSAISLPLIVNDTTITEDKEKATVLNNYFVKQSRIDLTRAKILPEEFPQDNICLENIRITALDVISAIQESKSNSASGPDGISTTILKQTAQEISGSLARIFNFSLQTGQYPNIWKQANVSPIHNKGPTSEPKNYRPISLLSCVGKTMERCVHKQLFNFLLENKRISPFQSAYTPENSTVTQLVEIYHQIQTALDNSKETKFVFCDCSKAFDRVWHEGALYKLKKSGITGRLHQWIRNYLENRQQRVVLNGKASNYQSLEAGVPQGSILGPLVFLIYINDITENIKTNIRLYADDVSIYMDYTDPDEAASKLNDDLYIIEEWAKKWFVTFNPDKTETVTFSRKRNQDTPTLYMSNSQIAETDSHKHLGTILQKNGRWTKQTAEIQSRSKKKVDILRGLTFKLNRTSLEKIYTTYIRPSLEYASIVWDNITKREEQDLEDIQIAALRAITGTKKGTNHQNLYMETGLEKLKTRRQRQKLVLMYKIKNNLAPAPLKRLLPETTSTKTTYTLRSAQNTIIPKTNTSSYQDSFLPSTIKAWNATDLQIRSLSTIQQFKTCITPKIIQPPSYSKNAKDRRAEIMHTRMRVGCSNLNEDLYQRNLNDTPLCDCGPDMEDTEHFILKCPKYEEIRNHIRDATETDIFELDIDQLIFGTAGESDKTNTERFELVQYYITLTRRF